MEVFPVQKQYTSFFCNKCCCFSLCPEWYAHTVKSNIFRNTLKIVYLCYSYSILPDTCMNQKLGNTVHFMDILHCSSNHSGKTERVHDLKFLQIGFLLRSTSNRISYNYSWKLFPIRSCQKPQWSPFK
jgi:hypothetical protein